MVYLEGNNTQPDWDKIALRMQRIGFWNGFFAGMGVMYVVAAVVVLLNA